MNGQFGWPAGFARVPDEEWTRAPVASLAAKYDSVERHGWYANLDPTVTELVTTLRPGDVCVDYSGGTGILIDRLLAATPQGEFGVVNADASPKFLRLSLDKFADEQRVAFRLLRFLPAQKRLEHLDEALGPVMAQRGVDAVVSANAIHLYLDLGGTLTGWHRCLRKSGRVLAQSGNIRNPDATGWIIDDTVDAIAKEARRIIEEEPRFARYREAPRVEQHDAFRRKVFVPPRALSTYLGAFHAAGFRIASVRTRTIQARTSEWLEFLQVYHEAILGRIGGSEKIDGAPPSAEAVRDRLEVMRLALDRVMKGRDSFDATWTYITANP